MRLSRSSQGPSSPLDLSGKILRVNRTQPRTRSTSMASRGKKRVSAKASGRPMTLPLERRILLRAMEPRIVVPNGARTPSGRIVKESSVCRTVGWPTSPPALIETDLTKYIAKKAAKKNGTHNAPQIASFENLAGVGGIPPAARPEAAGVTGGGVPPGLNSVAVRRGWLANCLPAKRRFNSGVKIETSMERPTSVQTATWTQPRLLELKN